MALSAALVAAVVETNVQLGLAALSPIHLQQQEQLHALESRACLHMLRFAFQTGTLGDLELSLPLLLAELLKAVDLGSWSCSYRLLVLIRTLVRRLRSLWSWWQDAQTAHLEMTVEEKWRSRSDRQRQLVVPALTRTRLVPSSLLSRTRLWFSEVSHSAAAPA